MKSPSGTPTLLSPARTPRAALRPPSCRGNRSRPALLSHTGSRPPAVNREPFRVQARGAARARTVPAAPPAPGNTRAAANPVPSGPGIPHAPLGAGGTGTRRRPSEGRSGRPGPGAAPAALRALGTRRRNRPGRGQGTASSPRCHHWGPRGLPPRLGPAAWGRPGAAWRARPSPGRCGPAARYRDLPAA